MPFRQSNPVRPRFWVETALGGLSGLLFLLTLVWPQWIETLFGVDPDAGSGAAEWLVVALAAAVTATCLLGARIEWRRRTLPRPVPRGDGRGGSS
ncbi:ABC transporter permease [Kitasatospora sp. NPDC059571]|uniref:ABC transporter permease n=1 Tax=Kitasatospora sp. NPDC059571 TaxID=3346871 RepID=UPI003692910F